MQSICNPYAIYMQSICNPCAIYMQFICNPDAIYMQSQEFLKLLKLLFDQSISCYNLQSKMEVVKLAGKYSFLIELFNSFISIFFF